MRRTAVTLLVAAASTAFVTTAFVTLPARADEGSPLPPPLPAEGCATPEAQRAAYAATAYKYLVASHAGPSAARSVHGLHLNDSAKVIGWLERSLGSKPPEQWQQAVQAGCTKVLCALEK